MAGKYSFAAAALLNMILLSGRSVDGFVNHHPKTGSWKAGMGSLQAKGVSVCVFIRVFMDWTVMYGLVFFYLFVC